MASSFERWEKDPFFSAAEEVQESADRMQSTFRTWNHVKKDLSDKWNLVELQRDLRTALGTTKWQLEEFERAVMLSYLNRSAEDVKDRHRNFIIAIEDQISNIQSSLQESALAGGEVSPSLLRLDKGECNEFASFLSGPLASAAASARVREDENHQVSYISSILENPKNSSERASLDSPEEKLHGHRRAASASTEIGAWSIAMLGDGYQRNSSNGHTAIPPRKIPSLSGFLNAMDPVSKFKWPKKGFRKWKPLDADSALLTSSQPDMGMNACFERSKSCLDSCNDSYNKHFCGWYGAIQRQIQRSQYQMQYNRPVQLTFTIVLLLCLIVLIALCTI